MARGIMNWSYDDLKEFIGLHGFFFSKELDGSHEAWIDTDGSHTVEVNVSKKPFLPRTLETMISNSGIDKEHWKKWTTLNSSQKKKNLCCKVKEPKESDEQS